MAIKMLMAAYLAKAPFNFTLQLSLLVLWLTSPQKRGEEGSKAATCGRSHISGSIWQEIAARLGGVARGYVWWRIVLSAAGSVRRCLGSVLAHSAEAAFLRCVRNLLLLGVLRIAPSIFTITALHYCIFESMFALCSTTRPITNNVTIWSKILLMSLWFL